MARMRGLRIGVIAGLAGVTTVSGLALAIPLSRPGEWRLDQPELAAVSEVRAEKAASVSPLDAEAVRSLTRRTLSRRPLEAAAWARLAWLASRKGDRAGMLDALDRSYAAAPYGPDITEWRLRFAFDRWSALTPGLRRQAQSELLVAKRTRPAMAAQVQDLVTDPSGRMAMALTTVDAPS